MNNYIPMLEDEVKMATDEKYDEIAGPACVAAGVVIGIYLNAL